jgi:hypothetical protein
MILCQRPKRGDTHGAEINYDSICSRIRCLVLQSICDCKEMRENREGSRERHGSHYEILELDNCSWSAESRGQGRNVKTR